MGFLDSLKNMFSSPANANPPAATSSSADMTMNDTHEKNCNCEDGCNCDHHKSGHSCHDGSPDHCCCGGEGHSHDHEEVMSEPSDTSEMPAEEATTEQTA